MTTPSTAPRPECSLHEKQESCPFPCRWPECIDQSKMWAGKLHPVVKVVGWDDKASVEVRCVVRPKQGGAP